MESTQGSQTLVSPHLVMLWIDMEDVNTRHHHLHPLPCSKEWDNPKDLGNDHMEVDQ